MIRTKPAKGIDTMKKLAVAAAAIAIAISGLALTTTTADARACATVSGTGYGLTPDISRWMATQAVKNSANTWAKGGKHRIGAVKMKCDGPFMCTGRARACR